MKFYDILVLLIVACLVAGCGGGTSNGLSSGSIRGYVVNSEGTPLPGATVSTAGVSTQTDNDGRFVLQNVPAGTQVVSASLVGYFNDGRGSASVVVVSGQTTYLKHNLVLVPTVGGEVYLRSLEASRNDFHGSPQQYLGGTVYFNCLSHPEGWGWQRRTNLQAIYSLGRRYSRFKSQVGVSDTESELTWEVVFKVIGDQTVLYQSRPLRVGKLETIDVDVSNILTLQLQVIPIGDAEPAVVWADPRVTTK